MKDTAAPAADKPTEVSVRRVDKTCPTPYYQQLTDILTETVRSYKLQNRVALPSETELSSFHGVGLKTVRNALATLEEKGLVSRVQGKGTFISDQAERPVSRNVVILLSEDIENEIQDSNLADTISGIREECAAHGYTVSFVGAQEDALMPGSESAIIEKDTAGGVILLRAFSKGSVATIRRNVCPLVWIYGAETEEVDTVAINDAEAAAEATSYLIGLGHEEIAFVGGISTNVEALERRRGYEAALRKAGLPVNEDLMMDGYFTTEGGYEAMAEPLKTGIGFTAVFVANDTSALGVMKAIKNAGLSIPDDVSVVGFDDMAFAEHTAPGLTTMKVFRRRMGKLAAERLLELMEGRAADELPRRITVPAKLLVRGSACAAPGYPSTLSERL